MTPTQRMLSGAGTAAFILIVILVIAAKFYQNEQELKGKLLLGGVTANSVRCSIHGEPVSCASAAAEDVKVAKEIRVSNPIPRPVSNANVQLGAAVNSPDVD